MLTTFQFNYTMNDTIAQLNSSMELVAGKNIIQIQAGNNFAMLLTNEGKLYGWYAFYVLSITRLGVRI